MTFHLKGGGLWGGATPSLRIGSDWKPVQAGWIKEDGAWVPAFSGMPNVGDAWGGGYYYGTMAYDGHTYAMVVADKASEKFGVWNSGNTSDFTNTSFPDGWSLCQYLLGASAQPLEAIRYAAAYRGGGFADWFVPSTWELELLYRNLKPDATANNTSTGTNAYSVPASASNYTTTDPTTTTVAAFQAGNAQAFVPTVNQTYYSSTYDASIGLATGRRLYSGQAANLSQNANGWTRPVRRVQLT